ncbi:hypothetical protein GE061_017665 [Apolygus lucorum]|uniref:Uncharacterized protein n=1 Tax=Apolygus lucorum TaxID=248454 RepID=A0A8S9XBN3_APOLU|nr:hypothetical protein GE061_017665 [Apolygus lucorum]
MSSSKKIEEFFTPKNQKTGLKRGNSSPELVVPPAKKSAGEMTTLSQESIELLMTKFTGVMTETLDHKLKEVTKDLATKDDVRELSQKVVNLQLENNTLREEVGALRSELIARDKRIDFLDNAIRRDNLIFSGLSHDGRSDLLSVVRNFILQVLGISKQILIRDVINLGGKQPGTYLLVKFVESGDVTEILKATGRLRGTNFGINRDYPDSIRAVRRHLFALRKELYRLKSTLRISVRSQNLIVEDVYFTWSDERGILHKEGDGLPMINSLVGADMGSFIRDRLKKCDPSAAIPSAHA